MQYKSATQVKPHSCTKARYKIKTPQLNLLRSFETIYNWLFQFSQCFFNAYPCTLNIVHAVGKGETYTIWFAKRIAHNA